MPALEDDTHRSRSPESVNQSPEVGSPDVSGSNTKGDDASAPAIAFKNRKRGSLALDAPTPNVTIEHWKMPALTMQDQQKMQALAVPKVKLVTTHEIPVSSSALQVVEYQESGTSGQQVPLPATIEGSDTGHKEKTATPEDSHCDHGLEDKALQDAWSPQVRGGPGVDC